MEYWFRIAHKLTFSDCVEPKPEHCSLLFDYNNMCAVLCGGWACFAKSLWLTVLESHRTNTHSHAHTERERDFNVPRNRNKHWWGGWCGEDYKYYTDAMRIMFNLCGVFVSKAIGDADSWLVLSLNAKNTFVVAFCLMAQMLRIVHQ